MKPKALRLYEYRLRRHRTRAAPAFEQLSGNAHNAEAVATIFRWTFDDVMTCRECFVTYHYNIRSELIGYELIAIGTQYSVEVHGAEVFRGALMSGAIGLVVAHNHPTDDPKPSDEDDELTTKLWGIGRLFNLPVIDHVIVTPTKGHYSYVENGRTPWTPTPS